MSPLKTFERVEFFLRQPITVQRDSVSATHPIALLSALDIVLVEDRL
jgi:hypothetical protein